MKHIYAICIYILFISNAYSQSIFSISHKNIEDTILYNDYNIIITLPERALYKPAKIETTEHGYIKYYKMLGSYLAIVCGTQWLANYSPAILNDSCKVKDIHNENGYIRKGVYKNRNFREDRYYAPSISITYDFVPDSLLQKMDSILDNVKIEKIEDAKN